MSALPEYIAVLSELRPRFKDLVERYAGLVIPAGDGVLAAEILRDQPNYSVIVIDTTEVMPEEYTEFGHSSASELIHKREQNLSEFADRCIQLRLSVARAYERLQGRKFHFLIWDDDDWSHSEKAMRMVRPGGLVALRNGCKWVLR